MQTTEPSAARRPTAPVGAAFVIMVADTPCVVRATGVRAIADVLAPPEAEVLGWEEMARAINVNCFKFDPSVTSSLKFLRKVPWARAKVEELYLAVLYDEQERDQRERQE